MDLSRLQTPSLVLDQKKLVKNIQTMNDRMTGLGVRLRPHGKTAKSARVMELVLAAGPESITASTLKEAEYFYRNGAADILYAVGIAPNKLARVAGLKKSGADIVIVLDSVEQAAFAAAFGKEAGVSLPVLIEIDSDGHRSGVQPDDQLLVELGRRIHREAGVALRGVMTHAGGSYGCATPEAIRSAAAKERDAAVECAERLQGAGLPCPVISIGSTPTASFAEDLRGVTEVRAGVYLFNDLTMAGLGVCRVDDIAISVLAVVIGHQRQKGWVIVDAGWTALSSDRSTAAQKIDQGYGLVCDLQGRPMDDLIVSAVNQEHGIVSHRRGKGIDFDRLPVGRAVRILPNHACATGAMHDRYHVVRGSTEVVDVWERINRW